MVLPCFLCCYWFCIFPHVSAAHFFFHSSERSRRECAAWFITAVPSCSRQCQPSFGSKKKKEGCKFQLKVRVYMKDSPLLCIYVSQPVVWQVKTILPKCVCMCTPGTHFSLCLKQDRVTPLALFPWPHSVHLKIYRRRNMPSWESAVLYGTGVMTWPSGCVQLKMWQGCQTQLRICNLHTFFPETKKHTLFFFWYVILSLSLDLSLSLFEFLS